MATKLNQDDYLKTALRLPRDLHAKIQESALKGGRSMNAEIVSRLESTFLISEKESMARHNRQLLDAMPDAATADLIETIPEDLRKELVRNFYAQFFATIGLKIEPDTALKFPGPKK